jgi:hypothetical protein
MSGMDESGNDRIDRAIDEAARGLTAGEPGAAFTMRVLARVRRRPAVWNWRIVMNPLSVAAVIAIAFAALVMRMSNVRPAVTPQSAPAIADAARDLSTLVSRVPMEPLKSTAPSSSQDAMKRSLAAQSQSLEKAARSQEARSQSQRALSQSQGAPSQSQRALSRSRRARSASDGAPSFVASLAPPPLDVPSIVLPPLEAGASLDVSALAPLAPIVVAPIDQPEGDQS